MALSLNPSIISAANNISSQLATVANQTGGNLGLPNTNVQKASLDALVADKSGAIGSALNGATGKLNSTSFNNLSSTVQSVVGSGGVNSLGGLASAGFNNLKSGVEGIAKSIPGLATGLIQGALQNAAAQGNLLAGVANDLISAARSKNLPSAATLGLSSPGAIVAVYPAPSGDWRIRLQSLAGQIIFPTTPTFTLSNKANYDNKTLVHSNFPHPVYTNSVSDDIQISCEWPVEAPDEAAEWLRVIRLGRGLTKMFFGSSSNLGAPPPICTLYGYMDTVGRIPVVVKEFKVDFKDDVHYVQSGGAMVPRLSTISITLQPVYSKAAQRGFNWDLYARGYGSIPF